MAKLTELNAANHSLYAKVSHSGEQAGMSPFFPPCQTVHLLQTADVEALQQLEMSTVHGSSLRTIKIRG